VLVALALSFTVLPSPAAASACRGTLSGSVTGKFECVVEITVDPAGSIVFAIRANGPVEGIPSCVPGAFEIPLPMEARSYTLDSLGMGRASVAAADGTLYTATKTTGQRGEVMLVLAHVEKAKGGYSVRGSYRARLVPAGSGKQGSVLVEVTFGPATGGPLKR